MFGEHNIIFVICNVGKFGDVIFGAISEFFVLVLIDEKKPPDSFAIIFDAFLFGLVECQYDVGWCNHFLRHFIGVGVYNMCVNFLIHIHNLSLCWQ
jgi:hypothetical protein